MNLSIPFREEEKTSFDGLVTLCLAFILGSLLYLFFSTAMQKAPEILLATGTTSAGTAFSYEVTTSNMEVDWTGGDHFDPRGKCPRDFFSNGFTLLCKKMSNGVYFNFLYHKGKKLLYRIDQDLIGGKAKIGLHWVEGTKFGAKYRIADKSFKGGKMVRVPNGKGGADAVRFEYGQAVARNKVLKPYP